MGFWESALIGLALGLFHSRRQIRYAGEKLKEDIQQRIIIRRRRKQQ